MGQLTDAEKEWMAARHIKLVPHTIKKFYSHGYSHDDLMGAGMLGLSNALEKFDPDKNIKFSTFACTCIQNEILAFLRKEGKIMNNQYSLNHILTTDKNGHALEVEDTISIQENSQEVLADDLLIQEEQRQKILNALEFLSEKQRTVIIQRSGLDGLPPRTQNEIAKSIGMSQANVSKIEDDALEYLRIILHSCRRHF